MEIDFTNAKIDPFKMYGGANGNKIGIVHQGETFMLKFPPKPTVNPNMSYTNSCISEYVACHIFGSLGIDTQETVLGRYKDKVTVACKDFEVDGFIFKDFAHLKNTIIDSEQNGYGTELNDILAAIGEQQLMSPVDLEQFFWEMFVGDALLGNFDRHNGNWGFLLNSSTGEIKIAPIYDCGSCLYPQMEEKSMEHVMSNAAEIEKRLFEYPTSAIAQGKKKINYAQFLMTTDNAECLAALQTIGSRIDLTKINLMIDNTPFISDVHKQFLKTMVKARKEKIIDTALTRVRNKCVERTAPRNRGADRDSR